MFSLRQPSDDGIRAFIAAQAALPFSYAQPGCTRGADVPAGFDVDHNRIQLGEGRAAFERAVAAIRRWEMFNIGWVRLCFPDAPIAEGTSVAVVAKQCGLWSVNVCRIQHVIDESARFGFAYGTLPGHVERGEECFSVEIDSRDNSVWYDILAYSRPNHVLARIGYPMVRSLQRKFARDSKQAMLRAVQST